MPHQSKPMQDKRGAEDYETAQAFSTSWNNLPTGSVYSHEQFVDWFAPLGPESFEGASVLELGCGNGSLLRHTMSWEPQRLVGVDLGDSVVAARATMTQGSAARRAQNKAATEWDVIQEDLLTFSAKDHTETQECSFDLVYSIGTLHHLQRPEHGFQAVLRNTKPGGRFHCWVYAHEGNGLIRSTVEPLRRLTSKLPWWTTKYLFATPAVFPYYLYAKLLRALPRWQWLQRLPLYAYSLWISPRGFGFFRHVAFDQLVSPSTAYLSRDLIEQWLSSSQVEPEGTYLIFRNGNSWKFGGRKCGVPPDLRD